MAQAAPRLTLVDVLRLQRYVTVPGFLAGTFCPNPQFWPYVVRRQSAARATTFIHSLRKKYGPRAWTWFPLRSTLLVLDRAGIEEVLASSDNVADPFLKNLQLSTFTPKGVIISRPPEWETRRSLNNNVLAFGHRQHPDGNPFLKIVDCEVQRSLETTGDVLAWDDFSTLAARISQQVIFGPGQYQDDFARSLARLVAAAHWGGIFRRSTDCASFFARINEQLKRSAAAGENVYSLVQHSASWLAGPANSAGAEAPSQIAFWLFVMKDAIELHTVRTLAMIASAPPEVRKRLKTEVDGVPVTADGMMKLEYLEACITETLRLWTPIPILLRVAQNAFQLDDGTHIEQGQQILLHAGSYHRDPEVFGAAADIFVPDQRMLVHRPTCHSVTHSTPPLYVFSGDRQSCAGQFLVIFLLKAVLATLLRRTPISLLGEPIPMDPVPAAINHFAIRFWRH